jgi:hypothetical protein
MQTVRIEKMPSITRLASPRKGNNRRISAPGREIIFKSAPGREIR